MAGVDVDIDSKIVTVHRRQPVSSDALIAAVSSVGFSPVAMNNTGGTAIKNSGTSPVRRTVATPMVGIDAVR